MRTYSELITYNTFEDRLNYLKTSNVVSNETFGDLRYLNQKFYKSSLWRKIRRDVILRDEGCDLGIPGLEIDKRIIIHHLNPITEYDIINQTDYLTNPEYMICTCHNTHNLIHYSIDDVFILNERKYGDTNLW